MAKGNFRKHIAQASDGSSLIKAQTAHQSGSLQEAEKWYGATLKRDPCSVDALLGLAHVHHQGNRIEKAIGYYQQLLKICPDHALAWNDLGVAYEQQCQYDRAVEAYQQAIVFKPGYAQAFANLGNTLHSQSKLVEAEQAYRQALQIQPNYAQAHTNLGNVLREQGRLEESVLHFRKAFVLDPHNLNSHQNLASVLTEVGTNAALDEAIMLYQTIIQSMPQPYVQAHYNLAAILMKRERGKEAVPHLRLVIELQPTAEAYNNLGLIVKEEGEFAEAEHLFRNALALDSNFLDALGNISTTLLAQGKWEEGFQRYECRFEVYKRESNYQASIENQYPVWDGSPLNGKSIFIVHEQGLGDMIHMVRYAKFLSESGSNVTLQTPISLERLFGYNFPQIKLVTRTDALLSHIDVQIPIMSLPHRFRTIPETVPSSPYLRAPEITWELPGSAGNSLKIGIVWASGYPTLPQPYYFRDYQKRSCPLPQMMKIFNLPNISFYSLQVGGNAADIERYGCADKVHDLSPLLKDFADTACAIDQLDLVITVDTAVAHLAGAMGKPTWTLLPFIPDWRWLLGREDTPWYSSMRLFRQSKAGDWQSVLQKVNAELVKLLSL